VQYKTTPGNATSSSNVASCTTATSFLDIACAEQQQLLTPVSSNGQLANYLDSAIIPVTRDNNILTFWNNLAHSHPALAQIVKDVSGLPLAGVGIERKFSDARRTCHFQRHHLDPDTITRLMMVKDFEGQIEKGVRERFDSKTEEGEAISYDDEDSRIAQEQYISDTVD
jgi:hypothetical protein